jgi:hypothetical protein
MKAVELAGISKGLLAIDDLKNCSEKAKTGAIAAPLFSLSPGPPRLSYNTATLLVLAGTTDLFLMDRDDIGQVVWDPSLLAKDRRSRPTNRSVASVMGPTLLWYLIASATTSAPTVSAQSDRLGCHLRFGDHLLVTN